MTTKRSVSCESENEQYFQEYPEENNISINILNDDCLEHVFKFLPILDRVRSERVCKYWKAVSETSWYLKKTLVLSPNAMGISELDMIDDDVLKKLFQKCGKHLSQIIYNDIYKLRECIEYKLVGYIATYCSNLTSLHLTASYFIPLEIEILAQNCKMIKELQLKLSKQYMYENELTKLFEENKNLETIALYNMDYICPSLMQLPEHKMKVIILKCIFDFQDILQSILKRQQNLKCFSITTSELKDSVFEYIIKYCKNLEVLHVCTYKMLYSSQEDNHVCIPNELIHLKHLELQDLTVNAQWLPFLSSLIQACSELVTLNIKNAVIKDSDIKVISNLTKLKTLNLSWTTVNTLQNICNLKELTLQGCMNITNYDLTRLIESSHKLELLDVRRCENINKAYIHKLVMCNNRLNNIPLKVLL